MLPRFFQALKAQGVPVTTTEWLALAEALDRGLIPPDLHAFYHLARALLVKSEAHYDAYDQAFSQVFAGAAARTPELADLLARARAWLGQPEGLAPPAAPDDPDAPASLEELLAALEATLAEQQGEHNHGGRWVGQGGYSPWGRGGINEGGLGLDDQGGDTAQAQAARRRWRGYRGDAVLDLRSMQTALRKLRLLSREGRATQFDLAATIDRTCRQGGELELVMRRPRRNAVRLLLLLDSGGSMEPHARLVERLFSAARQLDHWRELQTAYFHNCVFREVYRDPAGGDPWPLERLLADGDPDMKLILVGDAAMSPHELSRPGGARRGGGYHNRRPGIYWLGRLADHFRHAVWLNPLPRRFWFNVTIRAIGGLFPMRPLTLDGLEDAVRILMGHGAASRTRGLMELAETHAQSVIMVDE